MNKLSFEKLVEFIIWLDLLLLEWVLKKEYVCFR